MDSEVGEAIHEFVDDHFFFSVILANGIRYPAMNGKIMTKNLRIFASDR